MRNSHLLLLALVLTFSTADAWSFKLFSADQPTITIFSIQGCPHCKKAKGIFEQKGLEYTDISLSLYPKKRIDMIDMTDRLTVPQIFIHNKHIGGASDLEDLIEAGEFDKILAEQLHNTEPLDPRLAIPDYPPIVPFDDKILDVPYDFEHMEIKGQTYSYWDLRKELRNEVDVKDRKYHLRTFEKCFIGSEFVDYLIAKFELDNRQEALGVGQQMMDAGFFNHVTKDHKLEDGYLFYRFQTDEEPNVLNHHKILPKGLELKASPNNIVIGLTSKFNDMKDKVTDQEGMVSYKSIKNDENWNNFKEIFCELQLIDMSAMEDDEKRAFGINLYNLAIKAAYTIVGAPYSAWDRRGFFDNNKFDIGGELYSFNDLESGILRGNRKVPSHIFAPFSSGDARLKNVVKKFDNRIHFALNCGAKSCPPVKKFSPEAIGEELRISAQAFCEDDGNVKVDVEKNEISLTMILNWYSVDFGNNDSEKLSIVRDFLRSEKLEQFDQVVASGKWKVTYQDYDWSNDAKKE